MKTENILQKVNLGKNRSCIYQYKNAFCIGEDSVFLAHFSAESVQKYLTKAKRIVDLCAGNGVVGLLCAQDLIFTSHKIELLSVELNSMMYKLLVYNKNLFSSFHHDFIWQTYQEDVSSPSSLDFCLSGGNIDLIMMNPPYYEFNGLIPKKELVDKNDINDLNKMAYYETVFNLDICFKNCRRLMNTKTFLCIIYPVIRLNHLLMKANANSLVPVYMRMIHAYEKKPAKLVLIAFKIGTLKTELASLPPLIIREDNGTYKEEVRYWYEY